MSSLFRTAVAEWLRRSVGLDVHEVRLVEQVTEQSGYCETCYHETIIVWVHYDDSEGEAHSHRWYGDMAELVRALDETEVGA